MVTLSRLGEDGRVSLLEFAVDPRQKLEWIAKPGQEIILEGWDLSGFDVSFTGRPNDRVGALEESTVEGEFRIIPDLELPEPKWMLLGP